MYIGVCEYICIYICVYQLLVDKVFLISLFAICFLLIPIYFLYQPHTHTQFHMLIHPLTHSHTNAHTHAHTHTHTRTHTHIHLYLCVQMQVRFAECPQGKLKKDFAFLSVGGLALMEGLLTYDPMLVRVCVYMHVSVCVCVFVMFV